jgi:hypothetical protein
MSELLPSVLFLDIDGVLCTSSSQRNRRPAEGYGFSLGGFDPKCVAELRRIVEVAGCEIVLSSTWRLGRCYDAVLLHLLAEGVPPILDRTPDLRGLGATRGDECVAWLQGQPAERYVALDDDSDLDPIPLVHIVNGFVGGGLQDRHADEAIAILKGDRA